MIGAVYGVSTVYLVITNTTIIRSGTNYMTNDILIYPNVQNESMIEYIEN